MALASGLVAPKVRDPAVAAALSALPPRSTVVVALPRGGVPVAEEICKEYDLPPNSLCADRCAGATQGRDWCDR
jgi:hypothetical protein